MDKRSFKTRIDRQMDCSPVMDSVYRDAQNIILRWGHVHFTKYRIESNGNYIVIWNEFHPEGSNGYCCTPVSSKRIVKWIKFLQRSA